MYYQIFANATLLYCVSIINLSTLIQLQFLIVFLTRNIIYIFFIWDAYTYILISKMGLNMNKCTAFRSDLHKQGQTMFYGCLFWGLSHIQSVRR